MKLTKIYIAIGCLLAASASLKAQEDIHFSQFTTAPLNLNPASAGMFDGDVRLFTHYRTQWASVTTPYNTIAASADFKTFQKGLGGSFIGIGVNFFTDKAGDSHFTSNKYNLSLSYALDISGNQSNYIAVGLQGGMLQRSIDLSGVTWDDQWNGVTFDKTMPTNEVVGGQSSNAVDLSGGVYWKDKVNDETKFYAGLAVFHINGPKINFLNTKNNYIRKYVLVAGGEFKKQNSNISFLPKAMYVLQGPNRILNFGSDIKFILAQPARYTDFRSETSIQFGLYYRYADAVFGTFRFNWTNFSVEFSYDSNISSLQKVNAGSSALEAMLTYRAYFNAQGKFKRGSKSQVN